MARLPVRARHRSTFWGSYNVLCWPPPPPSLSRNSLPSRLRGRTELRTKKKRITKTDESKTGYERVGRPWLSLVQCRQFPIALCVCEY